MEFKKLEIEPEGSSWLKRKFGSGHARKTLIYIILGIVAGVVYYYFSEGKGTENINTKELIQSMAVGGFMGFFITNSPCAKNKC